MGLNCNTRINNIEGSNHNNNAIACNNNNLNANHSYSLLQKMCARVHVHYARVRVKEGLWGDKGGCTIYELQLNNISEKSSDYKGLMYLYVCMINLLTSCFKYVII